MKVSDIFDVQNARSKGFAGHELGNIPFVSNGFSNNGIQGSVEPLKGEKVFKVKAICVSAFGEATVQDPPFLPRGNGGSGLAVLVPKNKIDDSDYYFYASQINRQQWRFSYGRMVIKSRIENLVLEDVPEIPKIHSAPIDFLPTSGKRIDYSINAFKNFKLTDLFEVNRAYAPYMNQIDLSVERIPYVTTTEKENGISLWCNEDPNFHKGTVTVSLDGKCGTSFYQFDDFISGEKTAVLDWKKELGAYNPYVMFYIATLINLKSWRYNYGVKLSMARLENIEVPMPIDDKEEIDFSSVEKMVSNAYGSSLFKKYMAS